MYAFLDRTRKLGGVFEWTSRAFIPERGSFRNIPGFSRSGEVEESPGKNNLEIWVKTYHGGKCMRLDQRGFSLVELSIALGLVAVLLSVVTAGGGMIAKSRVHREMEAVDGIHLAAQNYLTMQNLTYSGISIQALKTAGLLPSNFDPVKSNAFGGDYSVNANADDTAKVDIVLANIPESAGASLSATFRNKAELTSYDKGSKVWKATF
jgi:prepilin-type N-terminal cleavage/methylation domain-containing protein